MTDGMGFLFLQAVPFIWRKLLGRCSLTFISAMRKKNDERDVKGQKVKLTSVTTPVCSCVTVTMHLLSDYHHAYLFIFLMQRVKRNFVYFLTTQL